MILISYEVLLGESVKTGIYLAEARA